MWPPELAGLPDSPYRLICQKSLQCVGQPCKALVVPGFNALVVPAGFNALICQHIAPLKTEPPHNQKKTVCHSAIVFAIDITVAIALATVIIPLPSRSVSASTSLCRGLVLHQGLMTSSVSLLGSTQPPPYCSQHKTGTSQRCGLMGMRIEEEDTKKPMYKLFA